MKHIISNKTEEDIERQELFTSKTKHNIPDIKKLKEFKYNTK